MCGLSGWVILFEIFVLIINLNVVLIFFISNRFMKVLFMFVFFLVR